MSRENACIARYLSKLNFRGITCRAMFQYDLYQPEEINVGDRVFEYGMYQNHPLGTVKAKYERGNCYTYYVLFDDAESDRALSLFLVPKSRGVDKIWLQLYTEEKYNFLTSLKMAELSYEQRFGDEYSADKLGQEKPVRGC